MNSKCDLICKTLHNYICRMPAQITIAQKELCFLVTVNDKKLL